MSRPVISTSFVLLLAFAVVAPINAGDGAKNKKTPDKAKDNSDSAAMEKSKDAPKSSSSGGACIVEMIDSGLKMEGKLIRETTDFIVLQVHDDSGQVRIPRILIKNIEYDAKAQLAALKEDDLAGRYKIGVWSMDKALYAEAIDIFESLKGKEGAGPDLLKLLAQAYEQRQQFDKALINYSDYLKAHPDDSTVAAKVDALSKQVHPETADPKAPDANQAKVVNGLEGDGTWVFEPWGNPGKVQFTTDPANNNKRMIVAQGDGGTRDKFAFTRSGQPLNLSDSKEITFRIFHNSPTPLSVAVAFKNAQNELHEATQMRIPANSWSSQKLRIDGKNFKAQRNDWQEYNLELQGKEDIRTITFMIYSQKPFTLYLDHIFFTSIDNGKAAEK